MTRLQAWIACVAIAVWIASLIWRAYHPGSAVEFASVDGVILLVFGAIFSTSAVKRKGDGKKPPERRLP